MEINIQNMIDNINGVVHEKERLMSDIIGDLPDIIFFIEKGLEGLRDIVSGYIFLDPLGEIEFFKKLKPQLLGKLIYYKKIYQLELCKLTPSIKALKMYLEQELDQLDIFFRNNADFIRYYRSRSTKMDEFYFLREKKNLELCHEYFHFDRDPKFSTVYDFVIAKIIANDMLYTHIISLLTEIEKASSASNGDSASILKEKWTDKKNALCEIIYGIDTMSSVNHGKTDIKVLASIFGKIFDIDMSDIYRMYSELRGRKGDRTAYLRKMIEMLNKRMDDSDDK